MSEILARKTFVTFRFIKDTTKIKSDKGLH